jgi:6,7-dimethyl-8-ribityllumazine synthase
MSHRAVTGLVVGLLFAGLAGLAPRGVAAQEVAVPVAVQIPILVKVLNFDRKLPERAAGRLVVGVLFQGRYRTSANVADEVCRSLQELPANALGALELSCVAIDLDATSALDSALKRKGVQVLYVSPLRAFPLGDVIAVSRAAQITTLTGVPRYVETGLAIGVDMKGERPEIVINLAASRAEGADLTAHLLKLARVVGDEAGGR